MSNKVMSRPMSEQGRANYDRIFNKTNHIIEDNIKFSDGFAREFSHYAFKRFEIERELWDKYDEIVLKDNFGKRDVNVQEKRITTKQKIRT